jgi:hypothetical protein
MKQYLLTLAALALLTSCQPTRTVVESIVGPPGPSGSDGADGKNGLSTLAEVVGISEESECSNGGTLLRFFLDTDESLTVSEGDLLLSSAEICNGFNGLQGPIGPQGPAGEPGEPGEDAAGSAVLLATYTPYSCFRVPDTSYYIKSGSHKVSVYTSSSCSSSGKVTDLDDSHPTFWLSNTKLGVYKMDDSLRVMEF